MFLFVWQFRCPEDAAASCKTETPTYVVFGCVMALDLVFFLNMVTGHLSAAPDKKTIPVQDR